MTELVRKVTFGRYKRKSLLPQFKTGDTIGVYVKVKEGEKERIQLFKGVVIKVQGSGMGKSFTVRKIASGVGVERTFPFASPSVDRVVLIARGKVRRSRILYLRSLKGRAARLESELVREESSSKKARADESKSAAKGSAEPAEKKSSSENAPKVDAKGSAKPAEKKSSSENAPKVDAKVAQKTEPKKD